jgi:hypothetical protein
MNLKLAKKHKVFLLQTWRKKNTSAAVAAALGVKFPRVQPLTSMHRLVIPILLLCVLRNCFTVSRKMLFGMLYVPGFPMS